MCSIVEDDFGDDGGAHAMEDEQIIPANATALDSNTICKKCNKDTITVELPPKEPQCKECFLNYVRHKFRATLGSSKLVDHNGNVLLLFDGREQSTVLLDMIAFSVTQNTFKKLHINLKILIIDDSCLNTGRVQSTATRQFSLFNIKRALAKYPFEKYYTTIGKFDFKPIDNIEQIPTLDKFIEEELDFLRTFDLIQNYTSKYDHFERKKQKLLEVCAKSLNCKFVFVPEINTDLAKTLLTNIALGRGRSVANDIAFSTERKCSIQIIRPIRDLNPMEIQAYIRVNGIECSSMLSINNPYTNTDNTDNNNNNNDNSIQSLTNKFINDLQKKFPSTVTTVFKTGDKIATPLNNNSTTVGDSVDDKVTCYFCGSVLDYYDNSKALYATEISRAISQNAYESDNDEPFENIEVIAKNAVNGHVELCYKLNEIFRDLCHGCRNIFRDREDF